MTDVIVVGNEKGGAGKSTLAIHLMTALLHEGGRVGALDLDVRQQSLGHFVDNRAAWLAAHGAEAPMPQMVRFDAAIAQAPEDEARERLDAAFETLSGCDLIVVDTPGADTVLSRAAHARADLIVTPMNDSFVDFDTLGVVDPVTLELKRPSLYSRRSGTAARTGPFPRRAPSTGWCFATASPPPTPATADGWTSGSRLCPAGPASGWVLDSAIASSTESSSLSASPSPTCPHPSDPCP